MDTIHAIEEISKITIDEIYHKLNATIQSEITTKNFEEIAKQVVVGCITTLYNDHIDYGSQEISDVQPPLKDATKFSVNDLFLKNRTEMIEWLNRLGIITAPRNEEITDDQLIMLTTYCLKRITHSTFFKHHRLEMGLGDDDRLYINFEHSEYYMNIIEHRIIAGANHVDITWSQHQLKHLAQNMLLNIDHTIRNNPDCLNDDIAITVKFFEREEDQYIAKKMFDIVTAVSNLAEIRQFTWNNHKQVCTHFCAPYFRPFIDVLNDCIPHALLQFTFDCAIKVPNDEPISYHVNLGKAEREILRDFMKSSLSLWDYLEQYH